MKTRLLVGIARNFTKVYVCKIQKINTKINNHDDTTEILIACNFFDCGIASEKWSGICLTGLTDNSSPVYIKTDLTETISVKSGDLVVL